MNHVRLSLIYMISFLFACALLARSVGVLRALSILVSHACHICRVKMSGLCAHAIHRSNVAIRCIGDVRKRPRAEASPTQDYESVCRGWQVHQPSHADCGCVCSSTYRFAAKALSGELPYHAIRPSDGHFRVPQKAQGGARGMGSRCCQAQVCITAMCTVNKPRNASSTYVMLILTWSCMRYILHAHVTTCTSQSAIWLACGVSRAI